MNPARENRSLAPPTIHLACMPYPSPQGTQALIHQMLRTLHDRGAHAELLAYAYGDRTISAVHPVHRLPDIPRVRSLRSGPSFGKVALDVSMVVQSRRLLMRRRDALCVAHNVESAIVARLAGISPRVYVAHTLFETELPTYVSTQPRWLADAGRLLDRLSCTGATIAGISPLLCRKLHELLQQNTRGAVPSIAYLPIPWTIPPPIHASERIEARARFGYHDHHRVLLYAGNLDGYQGFDEVLDSFVVLANETPDARLLVATASSPKPLLEAIEARRITHLTRITGLSNESDRRSIHAATDVAMVPRRAPGGVPIKMLDAMSRGVPIVVTKHATSELSMAHAAKVVFDHDLRTLASAVAELFYQPDRAQEIGAAGRTYVAREHEPGLFYRRFQLVVAAAARRTASASRASDVRAANSFGVSQS